MKHEDENNEYNEDENNEEFIEQDKNRKGPKKHKRDKEYKKRNFNTILGYVVLPAGVHCIPINTCYKPKSIELEVTVPEDGCQVCGNTPNIVGYAIIKQGFILFAEIYSNCATIEWIVKH